MYYMTAKHGEKEQTGFAKQPKLMENLEKCVDIAAGSGQSLAITEKRELYAWGAGKLGELGINEPQFVNFKEAKKVDFKGTVS
jgi:alpha-tubulin suppressor-like RCC1 family protein